MHIEQLPTKNPKLEVLEELATAIEDPLILDVTKERIGFLIEFDKYQHIANANSQQHRVYWHMVIHFIGKSGARRLGFNRYHKLRELVRKTIPKQTTAVTG